MEKVATVYFECEVFRPDSPGDLEPNTRYVISIQSVPKPEAGPADASGKVETAWDVLDRLTGSIEGPSGPGPVDPRSAGSLSGLLREMAGMVEAPADWSKEHDPYIHNTPKRGPGEIP